MSAFDPQNWALKAKENPGRAVINLVCVGAVGAAIFYASGQFPGESSLMLGAKTAGSVLIGLAAPILILSSILPYGG